MKFNNVIENLRQFCLDKGATYHAEYWRCGGECFYRYLVMDEIHWKLCTLVDRDFPNFGAFLAAVKGILPGHLNLVLQNPSLDGQKYIREAEGEFRKRLESVRSDCPAPEIPYHRNLNEEEAGRITAYFRERWNYVPIKGWYPINGTMSGEDKLFLLADYVEPYWGALEKLLGLPENHVYTHGETNYPGTPACAETAELIGYGGLECAYCDREFTWIIYFSHENTVTFAGSILPEVRKLLISEREHWNQWA